MEHPVPPLVFALVGSVPDNERAACDRIGNGTGSCRASKRTCAAISPILGSCVLTVERGGISETCIDRGV